MRKLIEYSLLFMIFYPVRIYADTGLFHHNLNVILEPADHHIDVTDTIIIPSSLVGKNVRFRLNSSLEITSHSKDVTVKRIEPYKIDRLKRKDASGSLDFSSVSSSLYEVVSSDKERGKGSFTISYSGRIFNEPKMTGKRYSRGFGVTSGIISADGVYLSGASLWVPWFNNNLITFAMDVYMPKPWVAVSQGQRTLHDLKGGKGMSRWASNEPMDEIFLIAGRFTEYSQKAGNIDSMVFLRTPEESLANRYLGVTSGYLSMYESLIGPFPYKKFALIENFWETGYGMPSFTLLGSKIIRFPFILHSSYPHELLHNWWGNGVFVDYDSGNWSEGLTAYMADHLIKEQYGKGSEYRRDTLQKYADYVDKNNDFPLSEFTSRSGSSSEAVGYGKSLMLWNMLRIKVGDEVFKKAIKLFYKKNRFRRASYKDIQRSFERVSGTDLTIFFNQWLYKTGAPFLKLKEVTLKDTGKGYSLHFSLSQIQKAAPYILTIPVAVYLEGEDKAVIKDIIMKNRDEGYELTFSSRPLRIEIDPMFDIFRMLYRAEIPPSVSQVFGAKKTVFIIPHKEKNTLMKGYIKLARQWGEGREDTISVYGDQDLPALPDDSSAVIFGWENRFTDQILSLLSSYPFSMHGGKIIFGGSDVKKAGNSFVISANDPEKPDKTLVLVTAASAEAMQGLARKLPHYGKYSYLVFEGGEPKNILKGRWPALDSPLSRTVLPAGVFNKSGMLHQRPPLISSPFLSNK